MIGRSKCKPNRRNVRSNGCRFRPETPLGTAYITVNQDETGEPLEVFVNQGKAGSDIAPLSEAIGKLSTLLLRVPSSMPPRVRLQEIINKLRGIGGATTIGFGTFATSWRRTVERFETQKT